MVTSGAGDESLGIIRATGLPLENVNVHTLQGLETLEHTCNQSHVRFPRLMSHYPDPDVGNCNKQWQWIPDNGARVHVTRERTARLALLGGC